MGTPSRTDRHDGLTIAQVLLLVLIAGVLGLLIYSKLFLDEREKTYNANCLSNLRQMGLTIEMYAQDNKNRCPTDGNSPTLIGSLQLLSNYIASSKLLLCTEDSRRGTYPQTEFAKITAKNISYSYVPNMEWSGQQSDSILASDRIYVTATRSPWPADGNHRGRGGDILFNDGHVDWQTNLPSALKDKDGKEIVLSP